MFFAIVFGLYIAFIFYRLLRQERDDYEVELEQILNSDKHKVKGKFE
ncbi:hypothetical protein HY640_00170 [Candidatus Woesearchaeota archaeon]|nr:hypothetical protein [Candidatus Woesearchaeota archaeon]